MIKSIWIVNQYATCPSRGSACRHFMLAKELCKFGYDVTIIAGSGHHFHHSPPEETGKNHPEEIDGVRFIWLKTPKYIQGQSLIRILAWLIFLLKVMVFRDPNKNNADIILHSSPSLVPFIGSYFLSRSNACKLLFEFRDVWPATMIELAKYSRWHPVVLLHGWIEKFALNKSDACISSLEFGSKRLEELGISTDKFHWLPNGVQLEDFTNSSKMKLPVNSSDKFTFGYVGTHGQANALEIIVDAASYLKGSTIKIVMTGDGSARKMLEEKANALSLDNITFMDAVPKEEIPALLKSMDGFLISWHDVSLYRYGTSANKMAEYFAAGKPVIQAYSGAGDPVEKHEAGITVSAGDAKALANAMTKIATCASSTLENYGKNSRKAAQENFAFAAIAEKFVRMLKTI